MAKITNRDEFENWLKDQPKEWVQVLVARIALRILPMAYRNFGTKSLKLGTQQEWTFSTFRAVSISWVASRYPVDNMRVAARAAARAAPTAAYFATPIVFRAAAYAARIAAYFAAPIASRSHAATAADIASDIASDIATTTADDIWAAIDADVGFLNGADEDAQAAAKYLAGKDLWFNRTTPKWCVDALDRFEYNLLDLDGNWHVWTQWYHPLLHGQPGWGLSAKNAEDLIVRITTQDENFWDAGASEVNAKIAAWLIEIRTVETILQDELGGQDDETSNQPGLSLPNVEPQRDGAMRFREDAHGFIDIDAEAGSDKILSDRDARDRHSEVLRLGRQLTNMGELENPGNNVGEELVGPAMLLVDALGEQIGDLRPGLVIPRGEALRKLLKENEIRDNYSELPPYPESLTRVLENLVFSYNQFVGLDPVLSKADEAGFGPDAVGVLISPNDGQVIAKDAEETGVATSAAVDGLAEESANAPSEPSVWDRNSRRYSESIKNFARAILSKASAFGSQVKRYGKSVATGTVVTGGGGVAAIKWAIANESWLLKSFADNPVMLDTIIKWVEFFKTLPLAI